MPTERTPYPQVSFYETERHFATDKYGYTRPPVIVTWLRISGTNVWICGGVRPLLIRA